MIYLWTLVSVCGINRGHRNNGAPVHIIEITSYDVILRISLSLIFYFQVCRRHSISTLITHPTQVSSQICIPHAFFWEFQKLDTH